MSDLIFVRFIFLAFKKKIFIIYKSSRPKNYFILCLFGFSMSFSFFGAFVEPAEKWIDLPLAWPLGVYKHTYVSHRYVPGLHAERCNLVFAGTEPGYAECVQTSSLGRLCFPVQHKRGGTSWIFYRWSRLVFPHDV